VKLIRIHDNVNGKPRFHALVKNDQGAIYSFTMIQLCASEHSVIFPGRERRPFKALPYPSTFICETRVVVVIVMLLYAITAGYG